MNDNADFVEFVTCAIAEQMFGLPIARVQDVFKPARITRVPLAGVEVAGVLNLRGRIVTMIDMRSRLGLAPREDGRAPIAIGIEARDESFGLLVDSVGEVLKLAAADCETSPINLDRKLAAVCAGVYRLDRRLLVALDVDRVLDISAQPAAA